DPGERQHFRRLARCVEVLVRLRTIGIGNGSRNVGRRGSDACSLLRQGGRGVGKQRGGRNGGKKGNGLFHVLLPTFFHQVISTLSARKSITTLSSLPRARGGRTRTEGGSQPGPPRPVPA